MSEKFKLRDYFDGGYVSTVSLLPYWDTEDLPAVAETRIFGGPYDERSWSYYTIHAAHAGHAAVVQAVREDTVDSLEIDDGRGGATS